MLLIINDIIYWTQRNMPLESVRYSDLIMGKRVFMHFPLCDAWGRPHLLQNTCNESPWVPYCFNKSSLIASLDPFVAFVIE